MASWPGGGACWDPGLMQPMPTSVHRAKASVPALGLRGDLEVTISVPAMGQARWARLNLSSILSPPQRPGAQRGWGGKEGPRWGDRGSGAARRQDHISSRCRWISSSASQSCPSHLIFCRRDRFPFIKSKHGIEMPQTPNTWGGLVSRSRAPRERGPGMR